MSICTGCGDKGKTTLFSKELISKSDIRFTTLGDLDELSAALGFVKVIIENKDFYEKAQKTIIKISAFIASGDFQYILSQSEADLNEAKEEVKLTSFSLPGESELNARLHLARTVARRAERSYVALCEALPSCADPCALMFLNRLSDALFIESVKTK